MNLFLIHPNVEKSCRQFSKKDPVRARKQLVECCQILAGVEIINFGRTLMRRQNGDFYRLSKPQINHPLIQWVAGSDDHWDLTVAVTAALALEWPKHASGRSFQTWVQRGKPSESPLCHQVHSGYMVCRRGMPLTVVSTLDDYATLLLKYLRTSKGYP